MKKYIELVLAEELPKLNRMVGGNFGVKHHAVKRIIKAFQAQAKIPEQPICPAVAEYFVFRNHFLDTDNVWGGIVKCCNDALKQCGIIKNDNPGNLRTTVHPQIRCAKKEDHIIIRIRREPDGDDFKDFVRRVAGRDVSWTTKKHTKNSKLGSRPGRAKRGLGNSKLLAKLGKDRRS